MTHKDFTHKTRDKFDATFEIKFLANTGLFEGYASVFGVVDQVNDKIAPGAFKESLAAWRRKKSFPPLLWQHEATAPIGAWREMREDSHGLFVKGDLFTTDIPRAQEAYKLLKEHVVTGLSIGYRAEESHIDPQSGVRVLTKVDLIEVSLVTFPANTEARVTGVKRGFLKQSDHDIADRLLKDMHHATLEIKNDIVMRRLSAEMRRAAVESLLCKGGPPNNLIPGVANPTWSPLDLIGGLGDALGGLAAGLGDAIDSGIGDLASGFGDSLSNFLGDESGSGPNPFGGVAPSDTITPAIDSLGSLTPDEGITTGNVLLSRYNGSSMTDALNDNLDDPFSASGARIADAAQNVEDHLGGPPEHAWFNKNGDFGALRGNKKVRFDINYPGLQEDNITPEEPHFHIQRRKGNSNSWLDVGGQHRYYFNNGE